MINKTCTVCRETKTVNDFYKCKNAKGKECLKSECKLCTMTRNYRLRKKKKRILQKAKAPKYVYKEYQREYYQKHADKFKSYREKFRKLNPDYWKGWYKKSQDKLKAAKIPMEALREGDVI